MRVAAPRSVSNKTKVLQNCEDGFSLQEIVIGVAIVLIIAVIGFISFQGMTDNARQAAVERAANDVFTAALTADITPNGRSLQDVETEYNNSSDDEIHVEIEKDAVTDDITVTATGWDGQYTAVRSTNTDVDGDTTPPEDSGNEEENEEFTGDINDYADGVFTFSTEKEDSILYLYGVSDNAIVTTPTNEDITLSEGPNKLPGSGEYIIHGGFEKLGPNMELVEKVTNGEVPIEDVNLEELQQTMDDVQHSPFVMSPSSVTKWEETGTTDISYAFSISSLSSLSTPPSTIKNIRSVFQGATSIPESVSNWDTSNITNMSNAFSLIQNLNTDVSEWDTSSVTDMSRMFGGNKQFNQDISKWETGNVTDMNHMFNTAKSFDQDISEWDVSQVTDMHNMFSYAQRFNHPIGKWETGNVKDMKRMFLKAEKFDQPIGDWETGNVKDMNRMFYSATSFNQPIGEWDTSNVENLEGMFGNATSFNQPIGEWDTSSVTSLSGTNKSDGMFYKASSFNQDISNWDILKVDNLSYLFTEATAFDNGDKKLDWDTSNVENLDGMFYKASSFNQDISNWEMVNVENTRYMFYGASNFNQDISEWDVSNIEDMHSMFRAAKTFNNGGTHLDWNTENVTNMNLMFSGANNFQHDLSDWNVSNVTHSNSFGLYGSHLPNFN